MLSLNRSTLLCQTACHPWNPGLSITLLSVHYPWDNLLANCRLLQIFIWSRSTLLANQKIANIMILSCRGGNFILSVTKNNLGKNQGCHQIWRDHLKLDMPFCHTGATLLFFVYEYFKISYIVTMFRNENQRKSVLIHFQSMK